MLRRVILRSLRAVSCVWLYILEFFLSSRILFSDSALRSSRRRTIQFFVLPELPSIPSNRHFRWSAPHLLPLESFHRILKGPSLFYHNCFSYEYSLAYRQNFFQIPLKPSFPVHTCSAAPLPNMLDPKNRLFHTRGKYRFLSSDFFEIQFF